jgi:hypothetical protein
VTSADTAHAVYRSLAGEFPGDLRLGLNLGFYRTFAVPRIAAVLAGTGKMTARPKERAKATGVLMFTLIERGLDGPEGQQAVATLNRLHARLPVGNDEFVYVLAAFCVTPVRWIDAHGWRRTTRAEKDAACSFYKGLAERMSIDAVPESFDALADWMDDFERRTFAVTAEGRALWAATRGLLADRVPRPLAPLVRSATNALLDDRLRQALTTPRPAAAVRALLAGALAARAWWSRRERVRRGP